MFASDGCIQPNIVTHNYTVKVIGKCEHTKVRSMAITVQAESAADALVYVSNHLMPPQTLLVVVESAEVGTKMPESMKRGLWLDPEGK